MYVKRPADSFLDQHLVEPEQRTCSSAVMPLHALMYYGYFDRCRSLLTADQNRYWIKDEEPAVDSGKPVEVPPDEFKNGIRFGQMQRAVGKFAIVKVDEIILTDAVEHDPQRHGDVPGLPWVKLSDDQACNILVDAIIANHRLRDALAAKVRHLGRPTSRLA